MGTDKRKVSHDGGPVSYVPDLVRQIMVFNLPSYATTKYLVRNGNRLSSTARARRYSAFTKLVSRDGC